MKRMLSQFHTYNVLFNNLCSHKSLAKSFTFSVLFYMVMLSDTNREENPKYYSINIIKNTIKRHN